MALVPADPITSTCLAWALKPLERQLGYTAKAGERVESLAEAMNRLEARRKDVAARVEAAQRVDPTQQRTSEVEVWLQSVDAIKDKVNSTKANYEQIRCRCLGGCSVNACANWKIGRTATKELVAVNDLYQKGGDFINGSFVSVTQARPPPPGQEMAGTSNLLAVEPNLTKVLGYLAAGVRTVGIFGMGGVGKTTLLKAVNNKLSSGGGGEGMHFQHVIWVVVSRPVQIQKLQKEIVEFLKLRLQVHATSRMHHDAIFNFLKRKRFVLLLDDIWEPLDLDEVGIPDDRVLVFTTRSEEVCGFMKADQKLKVECLQEEDAWLLFKDNVGGVIHSPEIEGLARAITKRCQGLPLALIVIGRAMSSKHTLHEWRHTLTTLKKPQPSTSNSIQGHLFAILKYSYDNLPDETTRQCFLFFVLFHEDWVLSSDDITRTLWIYDIIHTEDCADLNEVYDRGHYYIGVLKTACLLETCDEDGRSMLKMHDLIRDMAFWIASSGEGGNGKWVVRAELGSNEPLKGVRDWDDAERLSLMANNITSLPIPTRTCEKLSTLMLQHNKPLERIPQDFFQYFPALRYLNMSHTKITEIPNEITALVELRHLNLHCTKIRSLSINLRELKKLKSVVLSYCHYLTYIPYGLISELPKLQYLDLYQCAYLFRREDFDKEDRGIYRSQCKEENVKNKNADESARANVEELDLLKRRGRIKALGVNIESKTILDLQNFVQDVPIFWLKLCGLEESKAQGFLPLLLKAGHTIDELVLEEFSNLEELILTTQQAKHETPLTKQNCCFHKLIFLRFQNFSRLSKITWNRAVLMEMFPRLAKIVIERCHRLRNLMWLGHLPCLHWMRIDSCDELEEIICYKENSESTYKSSSSMLFPNLAFLLLYNLQKLHSISKDVLDGRRLEQLTVSQCPELKRIPFNVQSQIASKRNFAINVGDMEWWKAVEWGDDTTKSYLEAFVNVVLDLLCDHCATF